MIEKIDIELSKDFEMIDIITAFHYALQIGEEEMNKKGLKVFSEIVEDIRENEPTILVTK